MRLAPARAASGELELVEAAASRGWDREVERHRGTVRRIEQLLTALGELTEGRAAPPGPPLSAPSKHASERQEVSPARSAAVGRPLHAQDVEVRHDRHHA